MNPTATTDFVDIGFLCEAMLFYREVILLADPAIMKQMIDQIGGDTLATLLEYDFLRLHYVLEQPAIESSQPVTAETLFSAAWIHSPSHTPATYFQKLLTEKVGKQKKAERLTKKLLRHTTTVSNKDARNSFRDSVRNESVLHKLVTAYLQRYLRIEPIPEFKFRAYEQGDAFRIETDLQWDRLNEEYHRFVSPTHSSLSSALLLSQVLGWQTDLHLAASYGAELATDSSFKAIDQLELRNAVDAFRKSQDEIALFRDFTMDGYGIATAINSGARTVEEFLPVLENAKRFKCWTSELSEETSIIKEYHRRITAHGWADKLPTKMMRFAIFTGVGLALDGVVAGGAGAAAGVGLSAVDSFYLDKFLQGWKPNQFVNGAYEKFVKGRN